MEEFPEVEEKFFGTIKQSRKDMVELMTHIIRNR